MEKIAEGIPNCRFKCSICTKPDCDYDGDYISSRERKEADRNDKRAIWYRLTWDEIARKSGHKKRAEVRKGNR